MKNDDAVSPLIGIMLMVTITILLAAVIGVMAFGFGTFQEKPMPVITLSNAGITPPSLKIVHKSGDTLKANTWRISIVRAGEPPDYKESSTDFSAGDQIITNNLTNGLGTYTVTNSEISSSPSAPKMDAVTKYDVKITIIPYNSLIVDGVVMVR